MLRPFITLHFLFVLIKFNLIGDTAARFEDDGMKRCKDIADKECGKYMDGCYKPASGADGVCTKRCKNSLQCFEWFDEVTGPGGAVCDIHKEDVYDETYGNGLCIPSCDKDAHCLPSQYCGTCTTCEKYNKICRWRENDPQGPSVTTRRPPPRPNPNLPYPIGCEEDANCASDEVCSKRYGHCKEKIPEKHHIFCGRNNGFCQPNEMCAFNADLYQMICVQKAEANEKYLSCDAPAPKGMKCKLYQNCLYDTSSTFWYCRDPPKLPGRGY